MAIYQATFLTPRNSAIDVTEANNFTAIVNGTTIDKYRIQVTALSGSTGSYDTGEVALSPTLGDKETLTIVVPANAGTLANGNEYKWTLQTFEGATSTISDEVAFVANQNPVIGFTVPSTITTQSFEFTPTYSQAQNVPVEFSYYVFNDSDGNLLLRTPDSFSGNLNYTFNGFLSGESYQVQFFGRTQNGVDFQTALNTFDVTYASPNINIQPTITQDRNTSIINVAWGNVVVIPGVSNGTFSYISDFGYQGNTALDLDASSDVTWTVGIPEEFSTICRIQLQSGFTGDLPEHITGSESYRVGYDGTRWYFNNKGAEGFSQPVALSTNVLFIVVRPTDVVIFDKTADTFITLQVN